MKQSIPLFKHDLHASTAFSPKTVVEAVRADRRLENEPIPSVCVLEFDGDLTDWLISTGKAKLWKSWACFHTSMFSLKLDNFEFGIVPRTIGGPYAVLVAEQMRVSGAHVVLGLTSAGRLSPKMPIPGLVVCTEAIRDEGTSYHYLPPARMVESSHEVATLLESELKTLPLPVFSGIVWTTDAPYRETKRQISDYTKAGVLAVEMQAASLFAFAQAHNFPTGVVAYVSNGVDQAGERFEKGTLIEEFEVLKKVCHAGKRLIYSSDFET